MGMRGVSSHATGVSSCAIGLECVYNRSEATAVNKRRLKGADTIGRQRG